MKIRISGAKGGVGTTVTAAILAINLANNGERVLLVDETGTDDIFATVGAYRSRDITTNVIPSLLDIYNEGALVIDKIIDDYDHVIFDAGVNNGVRGDDYDHEMLVVRNDYLALRRGIAKSGKVDKIVLVEEAGRVLNLPDVKAVFGGVPVDVLPIDPAVARAIDAGLLAMRMPHGAQGFGITPQPV